MAWSWELILAISSDQELFLAALEYGISYWEELDMNPRFLNILRGLFLETSHACGDHYVKLFPEELQDFMSFLTTDPDDVNILENPSYARALIEAASAAKKDNSRVVSLLFLVHKKWFRKLLHYSAYAGAKFHIDWITNDLSINDIG